MYHIVKNKQGKFYNAMIARNGEVLMTSELFTTKAAAKKNIRACIKREYYFGDCFQDDSVPEDKIKVFCLDSDWNILETDIEPADQYIPGKNPKKKISKKV